MGRARGIKGFLDAVCREFPDYRWKTTALGSYCVMPRAKPVLNTQLEAIREDVAGTVGELIRTHLAPHGFFLLRTRRATPGEGIHNIQHVVMIMQENRSFDSYFGTFPGANDIPAGICLPDPHKGTCDTPYHTAFDKNLGGPHTGQGPQLCPRPHPGALQYL